MMLIRSFWFLILTLSPAYPSAGQSSMYLLRPSDHDSTRLQSVFVDYYNPIALRVQSSAACDSYSLAGAGWEITRFHMDPALEWPFCNYQIRTFSHDSAKMIYLIDVSFQVIDSFLLHIDSNIPVPRIRFSDMRRFFDGMMDMPYQLNDLLCIAPVNYDFQYGQKVLNIKSFAADLCFDDTTYSFKIVGSRFPEKARELYPKMFGRNKVVIRALIVTDSSGYEYHVPEETFQLMGHY